MARKPAAAPVAPKRREFRMHKRLLWDVITKQAGVIEKSVLEAVMNSIDAGATRIDIAFDAKRFSIRDDGGGFKSREEIENFFETFGYPHEDGDARYGRYRMGRGQLFCYGKNTWTSNEFQMVVDLKPQENAFKTSDDLGLGYDLSELSKPKPGCSVEVQLYDPLLPGNLHKALREIEAFVKYAEIPVLLNGKRINVIPTEAKWKIETDEAYFNLRSGTASIKVYNLGVFVREIQSHHFGGIGGEIVSKKRLGVNFARNDIDSKCKVWMAVQDRVRKEAGIERKTKVKLSDADRESMAHEILSGEMPIEDILEARVLTDVTQAHKSVTALSSNNLQRRVVATPTGDRRGDKAHAAKVAFVLSQDTLDRFGVKTTQELFAALATAIEAQGKADRWGGRRFEFPPHSKFRDHHAQGVVSALRTFEHISEQDLANYYSDQHVTVADKDLSRFEKVAIDAVRSASWTLCSFSRRMTADGVPMGEGLLGENRRILVGESDTAEAWTDACEHIWINRKRLALVREGRVGWVKLAGLLLHEFVHDEDDRGSHVHDKDFYEKVHDLLLDTNCVGRAVDAISNSLYQAAKRANQNGKDFLAEADKVEVMFRAGVVGAGPDLSDHSVPDDAEAGEPRIAARSRP